MNPPVNYVYYVPLTGEMWVVKGAPGGLVEHSVRRMEGVPDEMVAELEEHDWQMPVEVRQDLFSYPTEVL
jgi:hypothetical protein